MGQLLPSSYRITTIFMSYVALKCTIMSNITHLLLLLCHYSSLWYLYVHLLTSHHSTTTHLASNFYYYLSFHAPSCTIMSNQYSGFSSLSILLTSSFTIFRSYILSWVVILLNYYSLFISCRSYSLIWCTYMHNIIQYISFSSTMMTYMIIILLITSSTIVFSFITTILTYFMIFLHLTSSTIIMLHYYYQFHVQCCTYMHNHVYFKSSFTTIITYIIIIVLLRSIIVFILPNYYYFHVLYCTYMHNNIQFKSTTTTILT
ncbi:hypothetical protein PFBG_01948 [Plasmodium falciparum 7G8]|uniref:Uncharacterized protein n=1 Tax=Plasmodium falciparum (isolate 7G8) TaxID=57266 RepID=W7FF56_PLAF8|nr:hypothetical protein PFBG_01948 [Plasmodium falciparum 7G8]